MHAFPRRNTSPLACAARHDAHPPRNLIFFPTPRARLLRPSAHPSSSGSVRPSSSSSSSSSSRSRHLARKKSTHRNYQTPLDRPRGRPPVCSSGAAARIRSPSAPPGRRSRRCWMPPAPLPASVPPALPVRSAGVNPRNHPPSWTCSLLCASSSDARRRSSPKARASRVGAPAVRPSPASGMRTFCFFSLVIESMRALVGWFGLNRSIDENPVSRAFAKRIFIDRWIDGSIDGWID